MKYAYILLISLFVFVFPNNVSADRPSLQALIDGANDGDTIIIPPGFYPENIIIAKPLTLIGERNVTINSCENTPVITIKGEHVQLSNLTIEQCNKEAEGPAAIHVTGKNHTLSNVIVQTTQIGIQLYEANKVVVEESSITGNRKRNSIDLWTSSGNIIKFMQIRNVLDGIYMEQSHRNKVINNSIEIARYGIHLMFSNEVTIENNKSQHNFTGAMVMQAKETLIKGNEFSFNNQNVNSQGLLLYLTSDTTVTDNIFASNRMGAFIEESTGADFSNNIFQSNTIGVQWKKSRDNQLVANTFNGNVNDAQAIESAENLIKNNYWDASLKLDLDGDTTSEIPHSADPYFMALIQKTPEYQLFFQHPGMTLLKQVFNSPPEALLMDNKPSMISAGAESGQKSDKQIALWFVGVVFTILNILLIQKWRKIS